ncbi:MAG: ammonium transporter [Planctomycetia bacterium]|nr:ammonium transporter [Planctomycetia bacterium]
MNKLLRVYCPALVLLTLMGYLASVVHAQEPAETAKEESAEAAAKGETPPQPPLDKGDNAWVLTSSALVLMMTAPGLAMFYGGLVRKKNVVNVFMQCFFLMGLNTVLWGLFCYSLCFSGSSPYIGDTKMFFMQGVQSTWDESAKAVVTPQFPMLTIPYLTHMLFQGMFFIITPALIVGSFAERMKFSTMVVFMILWDFFVYCPLCHWVWAGGIFAYNTDNGIAGGALDFAGGTVVHISSGISALVCALFMGKRVGYPTEPMPPHNLTYTLIGAALLWVGWFGFNAGSALAADGIAASAFCNTHFSAAAAALAWACMDWLRTGKPTLLGAASGAVAGLVCITPASGYVTPMASLIMGAAAGVVCSLACSVLKPKFGYDDSLDVFGVHGVGGTLGAILTGVFATRAVQDVGGTHKLLGALEGGPILPAQLVAAFGTWALAIVATLVILVVLNATMGLRVSQDEERQGLDLTQHNEEGYIFV